MSLQILRVDGNFGVGSNMSPPPEPLTAARLPVERSVCQSRL